MTTIKRILSCSILLLLITIVIACGVCYADTVSYDASDDGSSVTVTLTSNDDNGFDVVVSGTGRMKDYSSEMIFQLLGKQIHSVTVQEGVTYIGSKFLTCTVTLSNLKTINLPDSLESIGDEAFRGCSNVSDIVIPENVKSIGANAFCLDMLQSDRSITIKGLDVDFDSTAFQIMMPFGAGKNVFTVYSGGKTETNVGQYFTATINKKDVFEFDPEDSSVLVKYLADLKNVNIPDQVKTIASDAFQNENGKRIESLNLNAVRVVKENAFKGIDSLKAIYAYNQELGNADALEEGAFANLSEDTTVYYKGETVRTAFQNFGITQFVQLKPYKTTAAKDSIKTVETGSKEEIDLDGLFDAFYETTLIETYSVKKDEEVLSSGTCEDHKYLFDATTAGVYELSFKAKDSDGLESDDSYTVTVTVLDNSAPYVQTSKKYSTIRALVKNEYEINLTDIFGDNDEDDSLTYYYTRDLSNEGYQTQCYPYDAGSPHFKSTISGFSPVKVSTTRPASQQLLAEEERIYFYAVDRFGKKSDYYTVTVIPHSCSLEITADDPADLKGVTKMMIKTADDTEVEPVETVNGVAYYDLDDLESYKYVVKKKGFQTVEQEFIQNQNAENINWKGMAYTVALEKDTDYDSAAAVDALIDAIGEVALTDESKEAIEAARDAYDKLDDTAKALVEKYDKLVIAEKTLAVLQEQKDFEDLKDKLNDALGNEVSIDDIETLIEQIKTAESDLTTAQNNLTDAKEKLNEALGNEAPEDDIDKLTEQVANAKRDLATAQNNLADTKEKLNKILGNDVSVDDIEVLIEQIKKANDDYLATQDEVTVLKEKIAAMELTVKGLKIKSKGRKFTIKWKKNAKAEGYKVQYKLENGKKFKTLKTVKKSKVVSKKLKKGKKYQFRVATYKTIDGKKVYGKWTDVKTVKCK